MKDKVFSIYLNDLVPEKQKELLEIVGSIEKTNWDLLPVTEICFELEDDE